MRIEDTETCGRHFSTHVNSLSSALEVAMTCFDPKCSKARFRHHWEHRYTHWLGNF